MFRVRVLGVLVLMGVWLGVVGYWVWGIWAEV